MQLFSNVVVHFDVEELDRNIVIRKQNRALENMTAVENNLVGSEHNQKKRAGMVPWLQPGYAKLNIKVFCKYIT